MDDILKRMLAVEEEADRIVADSTAEAERILEESLQKANEIASQSQSSLAAEVERLVSARLAEASESKRTQLEDKDRLMQDRLEQFRGGIADRKWRIVDLLMYGPGKQD